MSKIKNFSATGIQKNEVPNNSELIIVGSKQTNEVIKDLTTPPPTEEEKKEEPNLAAEFQSLKELVNKLLTENQKLKTSTRLTLAEAAKLIEEKKEIEEKIDIFSFNITKMKKAAEEIEKLDEYQNYSGIQLNMVFHNLIDKDKSTLFSISNVGVIKIALAEIIQKSEDKNQKLRNRLAEIEYLE